MPPAGLANELARQCPSISAENAQELKTLGSAWAGANGLQVMRPTGLEVAPISLRPMPFPRAAFKRAYELVDDFNALVHSVSLDHAFLNGHLAPVAKSDEFQRKLLHIYNTCREEGFRQPICLGILRSDYMLHDEGDGSPLQEKQVEVNTIASSFAALSQRVTAMHKFLLGRVGVGALDAANCPDNAPVAGIAKAIADASALYCEREGATCTPAVLFVVQPGEQNVFDQRHVEFALWDAHALPVLRATLAEVEAHARVDERTKKLSLFGREVSVVYFRAGYAPADYPGEAEWAARMALERSAAVKCPSAALQCVGAKKIQQVLGAPGVLERFAAAPAAARMRRCFAGLYPLGDGSPEAAAAKARALAHPHKFVLKPQREGGGNNLYEAEMVRELSSATDEALSAYILMDIIQAPPAPALFMRKGEVTETLATTELGTYGTCIADGPALVSSAAVGHLLRSKTADSKETGVAAGFGVLDSVVLYD